LAINYLAKCEYILKITNNKILKEEFLMAVQLILNSSFFTFDNKIYRQKFGISMGSVLSPIIVDLVLEFGKGSIGEFGRVLNYLSTLDTSMILR